MTRDRSLDVAVTGLSLRLPGSPDLASWWSHLSAGRVLMTRYDRAELVAAGVARELIDDPDYVPVRGHLVDADRFDNLLFRLSPREAELMDPQHRLMLEASWSALEDAGVRPSEDQLRTAVFASMTGSGYLRSILSRGPVDPVMLDDLIHGTEPDFVASRIAYKLGLTGPALAVQTACSSSLVAIHLATRALLNGDCDQALVVAAGLGFPQAGYRYLPGGVLSRSGACRPFDAAADGVVGGSGVACVVLRRWAEARSDGCASYGTVLGTAINNDGAAKAGYYAPSEVGQQAVIRAAFQAADVPASSIGYLQAHATGTSIGDPIEWSAASRALRELGAEPGQIAVGAIKGNIGHLDAASGLVGFISTLLVLHNGVLPPVAGFSELNPLLDCDDSPLHIPTGGRPWSGPEPRRAAVSAFGIGGTNAHVVLEQPMHQAGPTEEPDSALVLLSAADPQALDRTAARLAEQVRAQPPALTDLSFTLAAGRAQLAERLAVTGRDSLAVAARLAEVGSLPRGRAPAGPPAPVVVLLPGQGTQYPGMARPYVDALPGFADALAGCLTAFDAADSSLSPTVRRALFDLDFPADELQRTELAQPALFAVEHAVVTALRSLGITPAALVGHSLGEITAWCLAECIDLDDAARFVVARGRAMQACPPGAMLAVGCDQATVVGLIAESALELDLASVNGPESCVVAGPIDQVQVFAAGLAGTLFTRRLSTSHAFHSRLIQPALTGLTAVATSIRLRPPVIPIASNLTGTLIPVGAAVDADQLIEQAIRPVRFGEALAAAVAELPAALTLETGPGKVLTATAEVLELSTVTMGASGSDPDGIRAALGTMWTLGQPLEPTAICQAGRRIHLPGYPFAGPAFLAPEAAPTMAVATPDVPPAQEPAAAGADPATVLTAAWAELLGRSDLTGESNFFDLGGDSLLITRVARKVNQQLGIRVPIRALLSQPTLGQQAELVVELAGASSGPMAAQNGRSPT